MYAMVRPSRITPVCALDMQSLEETERSAYVVGQAQQQPARDSCQG